MNAVTEIKLDTPKMIARTEAGTGWIIFNNPERRNALSLDMWRAVADIVERYAADDEVRVAVMAGAGDKAFVSGADISEFEKHRSTAEAEKEYNRISATAQAAPSAYRPEPDRGLRAQLGSNEQQEHREEAARSHEQRAVHL